MGKRRVPRYRRRPDGREAQRTPRERIAADLSLQAPNNSYSPRLYYDDEPFVCVDCGTEEVWTAKQQQWWYEVAKGPIYSRAIRCLACRREKRAEREAGANPDNRPIRTVPELMTLVRAEIEPAIQSAGFVFASRSKASRYAKRFWIDYQRPGEMFSFAFEEPPRLIAELLNDNGDCRIVALSEFKDPRNRAGIMATVREFAAAVIEFTKNLRRQPPPPPPEHHATNAP